jgi:hypothetical protein
VNGDTLVAILGIAALLSFGVWSALKPRLSARRVAEPEPRQPVPNVNSDDVKRILRRDFPDAQFEEATAIVTEFTSRWESARVQLAALKMADGNLDSLRRHVASAKQDYRDILVAAEYPDYWKAPSGGDKLSESERKRIVDADWQQYESWLRK